MTERGARDELSRTPRALRTAARLPQTEAGQRAGIGRIEAGSRLPRGFQPSMVFGLLQTKAYIRTVFTPANDLSEQEAERAAAGRLERQCVRNYAGILIIWDRMFGTFAEETHRPTYGLTTPVRSYNLLTLQFGEYAAIVRDLRAARSWLDRGGHLFGPPGWRPADGA
ncbi:MAG TPA: Scr1 family TA system antitoxin-like transcriptional regulator [Pseudonocardia sp.]